MGIVAGPADFQYIHHIDSIAAEPKNHALFHKTFYTNSTPGDIYFLI